MNVKNSPCSKCKYHVVMFNRSFFICSLFWSDITFGERYEINDVEFFNLVKFNTLSTWPRGYKPEDVSSCYCLNPQPKNLKDVK